jgi:hypothetical protein
MGVDEDDHGYLKLAHVRKCTASPDVPPLDSSIRIANNARLGPDYLSASQSNQRSKFESTDVSTIYTAQHNW